MLYAMKELAFEFQLYLVFITYVTFNILLNAPWIFFFHLDYIIYSPHKIIVMTLYVCMCTYLWLIHKGKLLELGSQPLVESRYLSA